MLFEDNQTGDLYVPARHLAVFLKYDVGVDKVDADRIQSTNSGGGVARSSVGTAPTGSVSTTSSSFFTGYRPRRRPEARPMSRRNLVSNGPSVSKSPNVRARVRTSLGRAWRLGHMDGCP
jgi:hypothetical protein